MQHFDTAFLGAMAPVFQLLDQLILGRGGALPYRYKFLAHLIDLVKRSGLAQHQIQLGAFIFLQRLGIGKHPAFKSGTIYAEMRSSTPSDDQFPWPAYA